MVEQSRRRGLDRIGEERIREYWGGVAEEDGKETDRMETQTRGREPNRWTGDDLKGAYGTGEHWKGIAEGERNRLDWREKDRIGLAGADRSI